MRCFPTLLLAALPAAATTMTFDLVPYTGDPTAVTVTVSDSLLPNMIQIQATVIPAPFIGDLNGLYWEFTQPIAGFSTSMISGADVTATYINVTMNPSPLPGGDSFDAGVRLGTPGIGKDDIRTTTIWIDTSNISVTAQDFAAFGARVTSVGFDEFCRPGSSKLYDEGFTPHSSVPEPATYAMIGAGFLVFGLWRRRHAKDGTKS